MAWKDDDDWVGTPPEGRHARDRANPGFWDQAWPAVRIALGILALLFVVVIVLVVT